MVPARFRGFPCLRRSRWVICSWALAKPAAPPKPRARGKLRQPQAYYDRVKQKFVEERDLRIDYRPEGTDQFTSELSGGLAKYSIDPYAQELTPR